MNVRYGLLSLVLTLVFVFQICENVAAQDKTFTIVIDPGHGGEEPGAVHGSLLEKKLNLDVALALGKMISEKMPDVKVLYTRSDDRYVPLAERGAIANRAKADLFFSIHTNASRNASANGSSTFVMGTSKSQANLEEAMRENEVIKYEADYTETYEGFDPSSAESYIIFSLMQYAHFDSSLQMAKIAQKHYSKNTPMRDRGAAQGPYLVLWKATMPSVLTEMGFISNETDRRFISSRVGQAKIVRALFDAFAEYRQSVPAGPSTTTGDVAAGGVKSGVAAETSGRTSAPIDPYAPGFYVQLTATHTRMRLDDAGFDTYRGEVVERNEKGWYKYLLGPYPTRGDAQKARDKARRQAEFKEAFITQ